MSLNLHHGKFDYHSPSPAVLHASWAVHCLSDALWAELVGVPQPHGPMAANHYARRCWEARFAEFDDPTRYSSSCECVEMVLS